MILVERLERNIVGFAKMFKKYKNDTFIKKNT